MSYYAIETIIALIAFAGSVSCFFSNRQISVALLISLFSALSLSEFGLSIYHPFVMITCSVICLIDFSGKQLSIMPLFGNEINHAISYLYCLRVASSIAGIAGYTGIETSWLITTGLLLVQIILSFGDGVGHGKRINNFISSSFGRLNAFVFHKP